MVPGVRGLAKPSGTQFVNNITSNLDGVVNHGHKQTDLVIMVPAKTFDKVNQEGITQS